jgi:pimeloyl-ACP methyl ester carboxylesterase
MIYVKRLIASLLLLGMFISGQSQRIDTLIDVGTYKLHFNVLQGKGVPILFEAGAGNDSSIWDTLLKPLHHSLGATLITYDRQGFGKSSIDTTNLNITIEVEGLETALRKLGFVDKYFLVAHSLGGNYAMAFCQRNIRKVIGGVFIDIVTPCFMTDEKALAVKTGRMQ